jgi:Carboxymuconolactone decarboxylase family
MKKSAAMTVLETSSSEPAAESVESQSSQHASETRLQDLIPIAMVIVGGCEPCAESMVNRALRQGSSWQDIDKTLRIVAGTQALDCFAKAVGPDVIARMEKPLVAGRRTLLEAVSTASKY